MRPLGLRQSAQRTPQQQDGSRPNPTPGEQTLSLADEQRTAGCHFRFARPDLTCPDLPSSALNKPSKCQTRRRCGRRSINAGKHRAARGGRIMHDAESREWVEQLRSEHPRHEEAVGELHAVLVRVAFHELSLEQREQLEVLAAAAGGLTDRQRAGTSPAPTSSQRRSIWSRGRRSVRTRAWRPTTTSTTHGTPLGRIALRSRRWLGSPTWSRSSRTR